MKDNLKNDDMMETLKIMSPGTHLREGLENILRARTGALIVIGDSKNVMDCIDGGITINKAFSPALLYELAKMDGAIVVSRDLKTILYANALLIPDPTIPTEETGTRHKSAERFAKHTNEIVISISQRRNVITIYKNSKKYILRDTSVILNKANQAIQTLEKYRNVLEHAMHNLSVLEFEDAVTMDDVAFVIIRTEMVIRIASEIDRYIVELGNEGRLVTMQVEELLYDVENECELVIEDYMLHTLDKSVDEIFAQIRNLTYEKLTDFSHIRNILGYSAGSVDLDVCITPKGFRLMGKIPRIPSGIIKKTVNTFLNLQGVIRASIEELDAVEGISELRARAIKDGLGKIKEKVLSDRRRRY